MSEANARVQSMAETEIRTPPLPLNYIKNYYYYILRPIYIVLLNVVRCPYVRTSVTVGMASSVANDVTIRMTS